MSQATFELLGTLATLITVQRQVINLGLKTEAFSKSNFSDHISLTYYTLKAIVPL